MFQVGILTVSDKGSQGLREDTCAPALCRRIAGLCEVVCMAIQPDERAVIAQTLRSWVDQMHLDLILTTGGTGFSPRDVTPEATLDVVERLAPGLVEAMRARSLAITPHAMLSRAVAGIRGQTLVINLPGSVKGACECLDVLLPALPHALTVLRGQAGDCAR